MLPKARRNWIFAFFISCPLLGFTGFHFFSMASAARHLAAQCMPSPFLSIPIESEVTYSLTYESKAQSNLTTLFSNADSNFNGHSRPDLDHTINFSLSAQWHI